MLVGHQYGKPRVFPAHQIELFPHASHGSEQSSKTFAMHLQCAAREGAHATQAQCTASVSKNNFLRVLLWNFYLPLGGLRSWPLF